MIFIIPLARFILTTIFYHKPNIQFEQKIALKILKSSKHLKYNNIIISEPSWTCPTNSIIHNFLDLRRFAQLAQLEWFQPTLLVCYTVVYLNVNVQSEFNTCIINWDDKIMKQFCVEQLSCLLHSFWFHLLFNTPFPRESMWEMAVTSRHA